LKILRGERIDSGYTDFTEQQLNDIITCAASIYLRAEYSMNFKFTDLKKDKNYIGFESGIICFYPNYKNADFLTRKDRGCKGN